ncbi:unnamed protein product [Auanema sp. JU1783]|nr:unnamed protein product [Auanema sp. JU1783]
MESSDKFISLNEQEYIIGKQIEVWYGDILSKVGEADKTFIYAKNERSGQMGTVHNSLLYPVIDRNENDALPYFHPYLLPKALDALKSGGKGTFLIKSSSTEETGYFVLLLNIGSCQIQQFLIKAEPYGYVLCGRRFPSIGHIIDNYCNLGLYRGVSLSRGVLYSGRYLPLSHSSSCYSFSSSDMKTISLDYQNVASVEILWKYIRSHIWKKGRLLVWKLHSDTETLFEIKAVKNFVFKSSKSCIYPVDDAIFGRYTSAFVKNCDTGIFLNFKTIFDFVYCICTFRFSSPLARTALHVSLLSLKVNKFRSNDLKTNLLYSAHCCVDNVQLWSSQPIPPMITGRKTKGKVVFDESVLIPFMPDFQTIELSVLSHSNYTKEGQVFRAFSLNESYEVIEDRNEMLDYHLQKRNARLPFTSSSSASVGILLLRILQRLATKLFVGMFV